MRTLKASLLLVLLAAFASCADNSTDPGDDNNPSGEPGLNSSYSFVATRTDMNGNKLAADQAYTMTITGVDQTYEGKSGVTIFHYSTGNTAEYYTFSGNKAARYVGMFQLNGIPLGARWVDFPFDGGTTTINFDSVVAQGTYNIPVVLNATMTYAGEENLTVNGKSIATRKVVSSESGSYEFAGKTDYVRETTYWYAPSLQQVVKMHIHNDLEGGFSAGEFVDVVTLTGYDIK
jgi:hypothetical protein